MAGGLIGAGVGAATGLINHNQEMGKYNRQKELAAQMEANSPWTGVHGQMPQEVGGALNAALQGGASGAMMGQQLGGAPKPTGVAAAAQPQVAGADPMQGAQSMTPWSGMSQMPTFYGNRSQS